MSHIFFQPVTLFKLVQLYLPVNNYTIKKQHWSAVFLNIKTIFIDKQQRSLKRDHQELLLIL